MFHNFEYIIKASVLKIFANTPIRVGSHTQLSS